jgi:ABC-type dipeptide/oligopeptide/nickel transport system ATPase component/ABC-type dipeptide/oligopeptide/nickel transport system permease subunit
MPESTKRLRRFRWTPGLVIGIVLMAAVLVAAILAPLFLSGPADTLTTNTSLGPSAAHPFGTDGLGRDVLARSLVAARLTLEMTAVTTLIAVVCGIVIGTVVWIAPRAVREIVLRIIDAAVAFPNLIFALLIAAILGRGTWSAVFAIAIASIPAFARLTSNMAGAITHRNFVSTARLLGVPAPGLITRHLLPNMAEPLLVLTATVFATTLIDLSSLSFVGLGVQSPEYDFGALLNDALVNIYSQPLQALAPAIMITITGLGAMLVGDGLAASSDPRGGRRFLSVRRASDLPSSFLEDGPLVRIENLSVLSATGKPLVESVSLDIEKGEILGLVGESGSGKSLTAMSLARLLPGELSMTASTLRLGDLDLRAKCDPRRLALEIGLVYQDPGTTFNPAIRMGPQLTEVERVHARAGRKRATEEMVAALAGMKITMPQLRMRQHPHELSGGMLQRSMIASSLASDPALIIADESTTALDVTVQAEVLRQFKRINRERGTAILFISHDMGVVQALCDRVVVMKDGRIIERVTGAQLAAGDVTHPYTKALIAASPGNWARRDALSSTTEMETVR